MSELKVWNVTFNDGGWHTSRPTATVVAETEELAKQKAKEENPHYSDWDVWVNEFVVEGYTIKVYPKTDSNIVKPFEIVK